MGRKRRLRELERRVLDLEEAAVREFAAPAAPAVTEPAPKRSDQAFWKELQREVVGKRVERFEIVPVSAAEERVVLHFHGGNRLLFSHPSGVFTLTGLGPQGAS